jgi:hypothetical protein
MAAQAWKLYTKAKLKIANGTCTLPGSWRIALCTNSGTTGHFAAAGLSLLSQLSGQIADGNGYSTSGKTLAGESWATSGAAAKFDANDPAAWTATGGAISNIMGAVIFMSAATAASCHLLCYASLTSTQFNLAQNNTLTLVFNAAGIFALS